MDVFESLNKKPQYDFGDEKVVKKLKSLSFRKNDPFTSIYIDPIKVNVPKSLKSVTA